MSVSVSINPTFIDEEENESINKKSEEEDPFLQTKKHFSKDIELSKERKVDLFNDLTELTAALEKEKSIYSFISKNVDDILGESVNIKDCLHPIGSWIFIKIIGTISITIYFVGILEVIGLLNTLGKEIISTLDLIFLDRKRKTDFYQNYINENLKAPDLDLFFLTSIFAEFIIKFITFPGAVILILVLNSSIIYFGLDYFSFHQGELLNQKYSFQELMILIVIYVFLYLLLGIVALAPQNILKNGFVMLDKKNGEDIKINGHIFVYFFSMVISSVVKIILDRNFVFEKVKLIINNKNNNSLFSYTVVIIIIYSCSMISSLFFYIFFWCTFEEKRTYNNDISKSAFKIFGYIIYSQSTSGSCCTNCSIATDSCGNCLGFHICNCFDCCCSESNKLSDGSKSLYIIYKLKGIIPWFFDLLTTFSMFRNVLMIYLFEFMNIGFNPEFSEYLSNEKNESKITTINIISFSLIMLLYFSNLFIGCLYNNCCKLGKKSIQMLQKYLSTKIENNELNFITSGILIFILISCLLNTLISCFFYFDVLGDIIYYVIPFSICTSEYANNIILYIMDRDIESIDIINGSFAISFYRVLFRLFSKIFDFINISNKGLVLIQFIVGCSASFILIVFLILASCYGDFN